MLHQRYSLETIESVLVPKDEWHPHPTIHERDGWNALPTAVRQAHIAAGEALLGWDVPALPATLFLEFVRNGNRENYQVPHFARRSGLEKLVIAECVENEGRFLDDIVNGVWAICEETYWGVPAHIGVQQAGRGLPDFAEPTVDLFAAETGNLLAWIDYLLGDTLDTISPLVRQRMVGEIDRRILTPLENREDFPWMGFLPRPDGRPVNNWNPWICSNWLSALLLVETDEGRRQRSVQKILRTVDFFIDPYPRDGGCDEGPSYWGRAGASLFDCLDLLESATNGAIDVYDEPLIQEIGRFIYRVQIDGAYYINFADAPALVFPDAAVVYRYGQRIDDAQMMALGEWLAVEQGLHEHGYSENGPRSAVNFQRLLRGLFALADMRTENVAPPLPRDVWLDEIQVMVARDEEGASRGLFVAAKGGHNAESHNHNDIGNFIVYVDGKPVIVDAGVETYTAKTFSPQRYEIWTMQSAYHSLLPTLDGVQQLPGRQFQASEVTHAQSDAKSTLSLNIASAYPPGANIERWVRTVTLNRGEDVQIRDEYALTEPVDEIVLSIVTPCAVELGEAGIIRFGERETVPGRRSGTGQLRYPAELFRATTETIPITDERMGGTWGQSITRVVLRAEQPSQRGSWDFQFMQ